MGFLGPCSTSSGGGGGSSRSNLTLLPSVSPAAQPCLREAGIMEPHQEVQVQWWQHLQVSRFTWVTEPCKKST